MIVMRQPCISDLINVWNSFDEFVVITYLINS